MISSAKIFSIGNSLETPTGLASPPHWCPLVLGWYGDNGYDDNGGNFEERKILFTYVDSSIETSPVVSLDNFSSIHLR